MNTKRTAKIAVGALAVGSAVASLGFAGISILQVIAAADLTTKFLIALGIGSGGSFAGLLIAKDKAIGQDSD